MATPTCGCCNQPSTTGDPCEACRNHDYDAEDPPVEHDYTPDRSGMLQTAGAPHDLFGGLFLRWAGDVHAYSVFSWPKKDTRWIGRDGTECEMMRIRKDYHVC